MEGSASQAAHEEITDEGVEGMSGSLILDSPEAEQPQPSGSWPQVSGADDGIYEYPMGRGWWWWCQVYTQRKIRQMKH